MTDQTIKRIGRYEVIDVLGRGGMGVVYRALDHQLNCEVAIKTFTTGVIADEERRKSFFENLVRTATLLRHNSNTAFVYDIGLQDGLPYVVTEYLSGDSLDRLIQSGKPQPLASKLNILEQVCHALGHAHHVHVIHGNVEPANVMVLPDGTVKVLDFGIVWEGKTENGLTHTGRVIGKRPYMAPERLRGAALDGRSDIFSVGVMMFQLLTGQLPFTDDQLVVTNILTEEHPPLSRYLDQYPPALDRIIDRALAKNPDDRYGTAEEMAADIGSILREYLVPPTSAPLQAIPSIWLLFPLPGVEWFQNVRRFVRRILEQLSRIDLSAKTTEEFNLSAEIVRKVLDAETKSQICKDVQQNETAIKYVAGNLGPELIDDFEVHLLECNACWSVVETLQLVRKDLEVRAHEIRSYSLAPRRTLRALWVGVAALLLLVSIDVTFKRHGNPTSASAPAPHANVQQYVVRHDIEKVPMTWEPSLNAVEYERLYKVKPPPYSFYAKGTAGERSSALAQRLFHSAMRAYVTKRYSDAEKLLENARKEAPGSTEINFFLGACRLINGTPAAQAIEPLKIAAADQKSPYAQAAHFYLAKAYYRNGDSESARDEMLFARFLPGSFVAEADMERAELAKLALAWTSSLSQLSQAALVSPLVSPAEFRPLLSDEGEEELLRLGRVDAPPYRSEATGPTFRVAMEAYKNADYKRTGQLLELAWSHEGPTPDTFFYIGICRLMNGDPGKAIPALKAASTTTGSTLAQSSHYFLAKAYLQRRDLAIAEAELQAASSMQGEWTSSAKADLIRLQALRDREHR